MGLATDATPDMAWGKVSDAGELFQTTKPSYVDINEGLVVSYYNGDDKTVFPSDNQECLIEYGPNFPNVAMPHRINDVLSLWSSGNMLYLCDNRKLPFKVDSSIAVDTRKGATCDKVCVINDNLFVVIYGCPNADYRCYAVGIHNKTLVVNQQYFKSFSASTNLRLEKISNIKNGVGRVGIMVTDSNYNCDIYSYGVDDVSLSATEVYLGRINNVSQGISPYYISDNRWFVIDRTNGILVDFAPSSFTETARYYTNGNSIETPLIVSNASIIYSKAVGSQVFCTGLEIGINAITEKFNVLVKSFNSYNGIGVTSMNISADKQSLILSYCGDINSVTINCVSLIRYSNDSASVLDTISSMPEFAGAYNCYAIIPLNKNVYIFGGSSMLCYSIDSGVFKYVGKELFPDASSFNLQLSDKICLFHSINKKNPFDSSSSLSISGNCMAVLSNENLIVLKNSTYSSICGIVEKIQENTVTVRRFGVTHTQSQLTVSNSANQKFWLLSYGKLINSYPWVQSGDDLYKYAPPLIGTALNETSLLLRIGGV